MVTDTERREVAERLRRAWTNVPDKNPVRHHLRVLYEIYAAVGLNNDGVDAIDLFDRLADLIDPEHDRTYHPERVGTAYRSAIVCSECKRRLDEVTLYCPHCGARLEGIGR